MPHAQQPLTLLDSGGEAQLASFDLLYGHLQPRGQKLCYFQVQHKLLSIAAKKAQHSANSDGTVLSVLKASWHRRAGRE